MQDIIKKEQERLNMTISVIDELLEKNKQNMNKTAKDAVEAQLIAYAKKEVKKLQEIRPHPYFGRLDFEDEFGRETIYIGKTGVLIIQ
ncbi:hypothetical protein D9547_15205 [Geobacillus stearothermophilus]|uniref:hypothetical protein n=1 Tax=Geobacillus stearothermophilus TaxID=1422 RepID=UPI000EF59228|nr:hypothetical protein [Geobacillus stearothermophilus]RLQ05222.1 hypothetical protein D9547_15205 [Geobacillus stearothermophilus]